MRQERFTVALAMAFLSALLVGSAAAAVVEPPAVPMETVPGPANNATPAPAARNTQLPPEILLDRYLIRVERLLAEGSRWGALSVMNEIFALQREHDVALPAEVTFKYAQILLDVGLVEEALTSVNDYLLAAGREGEFYREALELLDTAEEAVRRADVERRRVENERRRAEALQRENDELARRQVEEAAVVLPRDPLRSGGLAPEMVTVAAGRFQYRTMQPDRYNHLEVVTLDRPFAIGKYEVTRGDFEMFVDRADYRTEARRDPSYGCTAPSSRFSRRNTGLRWDRPGFDQTDRHPVTCVSIRDAIAYTRWLSRETGHPYRLPSAAEWQYAERAGSPAAMLHIDEAVPGVCLYAHFGECFGEDIWSDGYTVEVGTLLSNGIGLHDMQGNVNELVMSCSRTENNTRYATPHGSLENAPDCDWVVVMGHSWYMRYNHDLRVNPTSGRRRNGDRWHRRNSRTYTGFRVVRELEDPGGVQ